MSFVRTTFFFGNLTPTLSIDEESTRFLQLKVLKIGL